jgi:serine/threonine protein phosphatase 1
MVKPYGDFRRVIRGFDPAHPGLSESQYTLTIDGGCGFGGPLMAGCLTASGEVVDVVEA